MWLAKAGGVGFLGLGVYDAYQAFSQKGLANGIEKADFPKREGEAGFAVIELTSSAHKVNGFILAKVIKKGDGFDFASSSIAPEIIATSLSPRTYAFQAHRSADHSEIRSYFDFLFSVSLLSLSEGSMRLKEEIDYLKTLSWSEGLKYQEGEVPLIPRNYPRAFLALGFFTGVAATWQVQKYWHLKKDQT